ncbi:MAG: TolC family protein [Kofleriaceae bacterium]
MLFGLLAPATVHADLLARALHAGDDEGGSAPSAPPQTPPTAPTAAPTDGAPEQPDDLTAWAGPARPTSLPELLQVAVRQAPSLATAQIDIAIAEARIQQTWSRDDWQINSQLQVFRSSGIANGQSLDQAINGTGFFDLSRTLPTGGTLTLHAGSNYNNVKFADPTINDVLGGTSWSNEISATYAQPLLRNRGRLVYDANERKARLSRDAATLGRRLSAIQTIQNVVAAYWDLVLAERQLAITQQSLALARERLRITEIGTGGGKVPRSELPAVQQIIATREEEVLNGELAVLDRSIAVRRAAGMPIGQGELGLRVATDLEIRDTGWALGDLTERAYGASPELAQLAKQEASSKIDVEVTENGLLPRLDAAITLGPSGADGNFATAWKNVATFESLAIGGTLTFQHSIGQENVKGLAREQRENQRRIQVTAFDVRAQIAQTMARSVAQLELARRRVALSQRAIDLANENIKIETDRFNLGKATNFDVLNRQEELRQAELRKAQAMIDWHKAETSIQALTTDILPAYGIALE